ncbi:hypothetical protein [Hymenobacter rubidus]|uniref:hypothetical protein n=1 Tax=Hymenobacter rubidus TaxID=1441626 RepID=UPI00191DD7E2|nr:hypothetical protein [Hymenobacter rubidus]
MFLLLMPRNPKTVVSIHDPALVVVFGRSRKSYERNRDELVAKLDAAAERTRAAATAKAGVIKKRAFVTADVSPVYAGAPPMETIRIRAPKTSAGSEITETKESRMSA